VPQRAVGGCLARQGPFPPQTTAAAGLRRPQTPLKGVLAPHLPNLGQLNTTIMILVMMRSILVQHLDTVPELHGAESAVVRT
jgi:hypothetical protein